MQSKTGASSVAKRPTAPSSGNSNTVARSGGKSGGAVKRYGGGGGGGNPGSIWRYYTDDAAGLKIGPTTVLVISLLFIAFVIFLHILGKIRR
eukprot:CAMPEP_0173435612 /NCGR_PEP_ID=MMETSP1357-20121228/15492_1 /TAXON_ID=77926 /ORGANISM="Hemiselmis rufescens, Strain PCC563" /LENGTH=91 /DNA_ID=CAMNT_0014400619 /DNA_START=14 /DNA_END=289 /DNA_ORIENTATION=-